MDKNLFHEASVCMTFGKNKGAINKFSKILENAKNIEESSFITALIQRATCYYREKMCKEALVDLKKMDTQVEHTRSYTTVNRRIWPYYMAPYYDDGYNCSKRIAYLKKLDLDILVNSNAGDSQNRGRSQSANR
ncbi:unnamed protein product [Rotaria socialis]